MLNSLLFALIIVCTNSFKSCWTEARASAFKPQSSTYWIDTAGDNTNPCSSELPCQTITHVLLEKAVDGDVLKVNPGIYREQIEILNSDLTIEGTDTGVFLFGSLNSSFNSSDGKFVADWEWGSSFQGTTFCENLTRDVSIDDAYCNTLGFWQDGVQITQVLSKAAVTAGRFYYDFDNQEVWLLPFADNENLDAIEGIAYPFVVRIAPESRNVTLKNLNIWYGASRPDEGILRIEGSGHSLIDLDVRYSAGAGIEIFGADDVLVENVTAAQHGQNGWRVQADASFSTTTGWQINDWVDDLQLLRSASRDNGWKGFDNCWAGGGTKFSFTKNLSIEAFYSADNNGFGIWLDIENQDYRIENSMSVRDAGRGIFIEYISDDGEVNNNVVFGTQDADAIGCGISVGLAVADSRDVIIKNNTVYSTADDVKGMMMKTGCSTCRSFPYPSESITWENNLLIHKNSAGFVRDLDAGSADSFVYNDTTIEEEFAGDGTVLVCWDGLGNCTESAYGIQRLSSGEYLLDESSECGFETIEDVVAGKGASTFVHPRAEEICLDSPAPIRPDADFSFETIELTTLFTDQSTDDKQIIDWSWDFGDSQSSDMQHPQHTYTESGTFAVSLTVTDEDGLTDLVTHEIHLDDIASSTPPVAGFNHSAEGLFVSFTDTSSDDGELVSWNWDFGNGTSSSIQNPGHTYAGAGTYDASLTVTDDDGLSASSTQAISVEEAPPDDVPPDDKPPVASFGFTINNLEVMFEDQSFDEDGGIVEWAWNFGNGESSAMQHPSQVYAAAGVYTITLSITDDTGLIGSSSLSIELVDGVPADGAFIEEEGMLVMEAEHYAEKGINAQTSDEWLLQETVVDGISVSAMRVLEDDGDLVLNGFRDDNANLSFPISLTSTGTFYIWLRIWPVEGGSTVYAGRGERSMRMGISTDASPDGGWEWYGMKNPGRRAQFYVWEPGEKSFNIWMREDGISIDRVLLTTDRSYVPEGVGPDESPRLSSPMNRVKVDRSDYLGVETVNDVLPEKVKLASSYPNPASEQIAFLIHMPAAGDVEGVIYDVLGRPVRTIHNQLLSAGWNQKIEVQTLGLPAGTYLYTLFFIRQPDIHPIKGSFIVL